MKRINGHATIEVSIAPVNDDDCRFKASATISSSIEGPYVSFDMNRAYRLSCEEWELFKKQVDAAIALADNICIRGTI